MSAIEIGSKQFVQALLQRGYKAVSNDTAFYVTKDKKCLRGLNGCFFVGEDNTVFVKGDKFYTFRGIGTSETFLDRIINTKPNKFWRELR